MDKLTSLPRAKITEDVAKISGIISPVTYYIASVKFCQPKQDLDAKRLSNFIANEGINVIINVSDYKANDKIIGLYKELGVRYVHYPLEDKYLCPEEYLRLNKILNNIYAQINDWKNNGNEEMRILVHCTAGVNRSALIIAHQLSLFTSEPVHKIIQQVRQSNQEKRRAPALTNDTFVLLLEYVK